VASGGGSFNVIHTTTGAKVDIFVPPRGDPFTSSRLARRRRAIVVGVEVDVATAEDVVLANSGGGSKAGRTFNGVIA